MLSGDEIQARAFIQNSVVGSFRSASYDLTIGTIISPSGDELPRYLLPPQGMVEVVSAERLNVPNDIAGYATVKTSLCNQGILAINIGIVDPGYDGLISSTLINFGNAPHNLKLGDPFLRLTFHRFGPQQKIKSLGGQKAQEYLEDKKTKVLENFSSTFLNVDETAKAVSHRLVDEWRKNVLSYVGVAATLIALLAFFINLGIARYGVTTAEIQQKVTTELQNKYYQGLEARLESLEKQAKDRTGSQSGKGSSALPPKSGVDTKQ